jgi:hypothetical protein
MMSRLNRWSPLTGVLFAACLAVAIVGPSTPDIDDSGAKVIAFYASHRGTLQVQTFFLAYGAILLVAFVTVLTAYLRRRGVDMLGRIAFAGSLFLALAMAFGAATNVMLNHKSVHLGADSAQTLNIMANDLYYIALAVGVVLMMSGLGIAIVTTRALPVWMGWVAIVAAVGAVTGFGAWPALMLTGLWMIVASIMLYQRMGAEMPQQVALPDAGSATIPSQGQPQASESGDRVGR